MVIFEALPPAPKPWAAVFHISSFNCDHNRMRTLLPLLYRYENGDLGGSMVSPRAPILEMMDSGFKQELPYLKAGFVPYVLKEAKTMGS